MILNNGEKKMKKIIAFLLALACIVTALAACGDGDGDGKDTSADSSADTSADTGLSEADIEAELKKLELSEYITLGAYTGIEINDVVIEVTDEVIDGAIDEFLSEYATEYKLTESDKTENGDTLTITYTGYIDDENVGEAFENGEQFTEATSGTDLEHGSDSYIAGIEEELIGHSVGETVTFNVTFPDEYKNNEDLEGVKTKFVVYIRSAVRMVNPEYTDALVAEKTDYETVAEHKEYIIDQLELAAVDSARSQKISAVWEKVIDGTKLIKYPEEVVNATISSTVEQYESYAKQYSLTLEQLLSFYYGVTVDDFKKQVEEECREYVLEEMIRIVIIERESLEINDREYNEGAKEYAAKFGFEDVAALEKEYGKETVYENVQWDKVCDFLLENAVILPAETEE